MKLNFFSLYYHLNLSLIAYTQIAFPKLCALSILFFGVTVIIGIIKKELVFKFNNTISFLFLLYIIYLLGTLFTNNQELANHYIESKLSFIFFPLFFSFKSKFKFNFELILLAGIIGVFQASIVGLFFAIQCSSVSELSFPCFSSIGISPIHHPTYFSVFILFSIVASWVGYYNKFKWFSIKWIVPLSIYLFIIYFLCMSLAGMLFLIISIFGLIVFLFWRKFGKIKTVFLLIFSPIILFLTLSNLPILKTDFNQTSESFSIFVNNPKQFINNKRDYKTGNEIRMIMWIASMEVIIKNPMGVGTGNVDDHLQSKLLSYKQGDMVLENFNPHNQFLQTTIEIGIFGLIVLLLFLAGALRVGFRSKNWLLILLVSSLVFNSLFESMLQRQSGIVFYSFWICMLVVYSSTFNKTETSKELS